MIKIAYFVGAMNCGGTETMLMNLFKSLDKNKYDVTFIENMPDKYWYDDEIIANGGKIVKIQTFNFKRINSYVNELISLFKKEKYDVVHTHTYLHSGIVMYAAYKAGVKVRIAHSHSAMDKKDNGYFKTLFLRHLILKYANKLVACSTEAGISLYGHDKAIVLPNPIPLEKIKNVNLDNVLELKNKYGIKDELVIGHVGRLVEVKNHGFMIQIANILKTKGVNFKMFFLGDGELKNDITESINANHLENNIIMTGNVSNVYEYMKLFDLLILPSRYEGLPVTLVEAQASNLYAMVSNKVSKESDLGLDLIEFLPLDIDIWADKILSYRKKTVSENVIYECIIDKKYDAASSKCEYEKLYEGDY